MKIINYLHFYQPHNQQDDILNRIVEESYRPILNGLKSSKNGKLVVNITGGLLLLLKQKGYEDIINLFKDLLDTEKIEITGTAMYHAFLPLLPEEEIEMQITANENIGQEFFGSDYKPKGFFSPEMAINDKLMGVLTRHSYSWISTPAVAYGPVPASTNKLYKDKNTGLYVFFRNKVISSIILSAAARTVDDLLTETRDLQEKDGYWFNVMDAETFGHHRIGHEKFLIKLWESDKFENTTVRDFLRDNKSNMPVEEVALRPSTWTNEEQDFWLDKERKQATEAKSYILWKDPENPIHNLQWELTNKIVQLVDKYDNKDSAEWQTARQKLDKAVASDQYWWASAKPWWSLEMIEQGAFALKDVIEDLDIPEEHKVDADDLYRRILDQAFEWQRSGYIRKRHLENSGTFMRDPFKDRTPPEWYNQVVLEFEYDMNEAAKERAYERAIKWRDALEKMKTGHDKFDVLHVVDELWLGRNIPFNATKVKPFLEHKWEEFSDFAKDNFICVSNKQEFEEWKRNKEPPTK